MPVSPYHNKTKHHIFKLYRMHFSLLCLCSSVLSNELEETNNSNENRHSYILHKLQIYILSNLSDAGSDFRVTVTMKERVHY